MGALDSGQERVAANKAIAVRVLEECFNQGQLAVLPELVGQAANDRQHPDERDFVAHLGRVIVAMRTAFPDLHFRVDTVIGEGEWVAMHSMMTGTHLGPLAPPILPPGGPDTIPATGKRIAVPHMHMIRNEAGKGVELFHLMDTFGLMRQLGILSDRARGVPA
ncbi:MAG: ester cyclase [Thermomicrobiales bacterium]